MAVVKRYINGEWVPVIIGRDGVAATVSLGSVTQLDADETPTVANSGTTAAAVLDFGLPRAKNLELGTVTVVNPDQNPSITDSGLVNGAVYDFDLPRAPTFTVGTVTTGAPGSSATVSDVGTNGDVVLDFGIPKGDKGDTGIGLPATTPNDGDMLEYSASSGTWIAVAGARLA